MDRSPKLRPATLPGVFVKHGAAALFGTVLLLGGLTVAGRAATPPVITGSTNAFGNVGDAFQYPILATGATNYGVVGALPPGLLPPGTNGLITGLPQVSGVFTSTITAVGAGGTASNNVVFTFNPPLRPSLLSPQTAYAMDQEPFFYAFQSLPNQSNAPTSFGVSNLPFGLVLSSTVTTNASFTNILVTNYFLTGTPLATGSFPLTVVTRNNEAGGPVQAATNIVTLIVVPPAAPVITTPGVATATAGLPFTFDVVAINNPRRFFASTNGVTFPVTRPLNLGNGLFFDEVRTGSSVVGRIYGTPGQPGAQTIDIYAENDTGASPVQSLQITVAAPQPTVILTQPLGEGNYVLGSSFFLNAQAFDRLPDNIVANSVGFEQVIGGANIPVPGTVKRYGDFYGVEFYPDQGVGAGFAVRAFGQNNLGQQVNSFDFPMLAQTPRRDFPTVQMLPLFPGPAPQAGGTITLRARASAAINPVQRVEFYVNKVFVGAAAAPAAGTVDEYRFDWPTPLNPDSFEISARVVSVNIAAGEIGLGSPPFYASTITQVPILVNTGSGVPPIVNIVDPFDGDELILNVPQRIEAQASVLGGSIKFVQFYANGQPIGGPVESAPFAVDFTPTSYGTYELFAIATSSAGIPNISGTVKVYVYKDDPPTVTLDAPDSALAGEIVELEATAEDSDGVVRSVQFFSNGVPLPSPDALNNPNPDLAPPYTYALPVTAPGLYNLVARATDNDGNVTDSAPVAMRVTVGKPPTVTITAPASLDIVTPQAPFTIIWTSSDEDGFVTQTQVFVNGVLFQTFPSGSGNLTYIFPSQGYYRFVIRATDNFGNFGDSDEIFVQVDNLAQNINPLVTLNQETFSDQGYVIGSQLFFNATATAQAPSAIIESNGVSFLLGSDVTLPAKQNGVVKDGQPPYFSAGHVIKAGSPSIVTASAVDSDGNIGFSDTKSFYFANPFSPLPSVDILPLLPSTQPVAGGDLELRAKATFPLSQFNGGTNAATARVEFYADGVLLGIADANTNTATTNVFSHSFKWKTPTNAASFRLTARAVQLNFNSPVIVGTNVVAVVPYYGSVFSPQVQTVNTFTNAAPGVTITKPATNNALVGVGLTTRIEASVTNLATNAAVKEVQFYTDGLLATNVTKFPYVFDFTPTNTGLYNIAAVVVDSFGLQGNSTVRTVRATAGQPPAVSLTTPNSAAATAAVTGGSVSSVAVTGGGVGYSSAPGVRLVGGGGTDAAASATVSAGQVSSVAVVVPGAGYTSAPAVVIDPPPVTVGTNSSVLLQATGTDPDGSVVQVDFLVNGAPVATVTNSPFNYSLPVTNPGLFELVARATDNLGNATDSPAIFLTALKGAPPQVVLNAPTGALVGETVRLTATASAQAGADVLSVEYIVNGSSRGSSTNALAGFPLDFVPTSPGTYTLLARATDSLGNVGQSPLRTMVVEQGAAPTILITAPAQGTEIFPPAQLTIKATADGGDGSVSQVEFFVNGVPTGPALTQPPFQTAYVAGAFGIYRITARVTNTFGQQAEDVVTIVAEAPLPGSNGDFILQMYDQLLGLTPSQEDFAFYLEQLNLHDLDPNQGLSRAQVALELLFSDAYDNVQNRLTDFYYRLGVAPARATFAQQVVTLQDPAVPGNTALLPLTSYPPYSTNPTPPFGATEAQATAAQQIINSAAFEVVNPGVRKLTSIPFLQWFYARLGGQLGDAFAVDGMMGTYSPARDAKGAAVAFLTAAYEYNIVKPLADAQNQQLAADLKAYTFQLRATAAQWLLGGPWQAPTAPPVRDEEQLLAFLEALLQEPTVLLSVSPANLIEGQSTTVTIGATSNSRAELQKVELLVGSETVAQTASVPFSISRAFATPGQYTLRARATDAARNVSQSETITVTVAPTGGPQPPTFEQWASEIHNLSGAQAARDADPDGDGLSNYQEFVFGSDPTQPETAQPMGMTAVRGTGNFALHFDTMVGRRYQAEFATNLTTADWQPLGNELAGDGGRHTVTDDTGDAARRFYRIVVKEVQP